MEFYLLHYFKAGVGKQTAESSLGRIAFNQIGCATCHIPNLTIARDRRVADVETNYDAQRGNPFNHMFAVAVPSFAEVNDGSELPTLKVANGGPFVVRNFFADMKRHDLGKNFHELEFNNTFRTVFMTEPLWGVGTTAPYGHDGRSQNLEEVILRHGGEALQARNRFAALGAITQRWIFEFLQTLQLFPPDDTASTLQPMDTSNPDFPQRGHGAIALTVLFNDPTDIE
jgi:cytochrome c peroxidase